MFGELTAMANAINLSEDIDKISVNLFTDYTVNRLNIYWLQAKYDTRAKRVKWAVKLAEKDSRSVVISHKDAMMNSSVPQWNVVITFTYLNFAEQAWAQWPDAKALFSALPNLGFAAEDGFVLKISDDQKRWWPPKVECESRRLFQTKGTCWFNAALNGLLFGKQGLRFLGSQINMFYDALKDNDKMKFKGLVNTDISDICLPDDIPGRPPFSLWTIVYFLLCNKRLTMDTKPFFRTERRVNVAASIIESHSARTMRVIGGDSLNALMLLMRSMKNCRLAIIGSEETFISVAQFHFNIWIAQQMRFEKSQGAAAYKAFDVVVFNNVKTITGDETYPDGIDQFHDEFTIGNHTYVLDHVNFSIGGVKTGHAMCAGFCKDGKQVIVDSNNSDAHTYYSEWRRGLLHAFKDIKMMTTYMTMSDQPGSHPLQVIKLNYVVYIIKQPEVDSYCSVLEKKLK